MIYDLLIRETVSISALLPTSGMLDNSNDRSLSFALLDNNVTLLVKQTAKTCHKINRYGAIAFDIVLLIAIQNKIYELLNYNKAI